MKKVILILAVAGIFVLTLNSCARSCKGGMCPSWSQIDAPKKSDTSVTFHFPDSINNGIYQNGYNIRP